MADKILIVDDEPEIADLVSLYLQNFVMQPGYTIQTIILP